VTAPTLELEGETAATELVSLRVARQLVGIPVRHVHDVLHPQRITAVPTAAADIAGLLNLRGRVVTAIDLRRRLGMAPRHPATRSMSVVVEHRGELCSLLVDEVGGVLDAPRDRFEADLAALSPAWRELALGIFRLDRNLLVLLDVGRVLDITDTAVARVAER